MASVEKFEDLEVWQKARALANEIYAISSRGGFSKDFVLRDQIRGAAVSVVSNIAEGFERGGNQEFLQFLSIAKGSAGELRSDLYLALDQGYFDRAEFDRLRDLAVEVSGKLGGLMAYLKASSMTGFKYRVDEPGTLNPEPETLNPEPGTLNFERRGQHGFSIVTAVFLVVVLALLGAFIVSVSGLQQSSHALDVQGVRAYQAARAGIEWGAYQVLDPNNTLNPATCSPLVMPGCPASPTHISTLAGSLSAFTVSVTCVVAGDTTEGNRSVRVYRITARACNQPSGGSCLATTPATGYVEREIQATLSKCKDPTAAAPRCACG